MRILAIDTALANCAVAVLDDGNEPALLTIREMEIGRGHAEHLMNLTGDVMAEASVAFNNLDRIGVTVGPGSFTGLRVGLSVARGFGLVLKKPVIGITTLEAIAAGCADPDGQGRLLVALKAKGDEVYAQYFSAQGTPDGEPAVYRIDDLVNTIGDNDMLAGSAAMDLAERAGLDHSRVVSEAAFPNIADVARLGLSAPAKQGAPGPLYLRPPDATPQTKGRIERK